MAKINASGSISIRFVQWVVSWLGGDVVGSSEQQVSLAPVVAEVEPQVLQLIAVSGGDTEETTGASTENESDRIERIDKGISPCLSVETVGVNTPESWDDSQGGLLSYLFDDG